MTSEKKHLELNEDNLFDNPMVRAAREALSEEDKARYKRQGEEMYNSIDFEKNKVLSNLPEEMLESLAYVEGQLRSGLHPSDMDDNDKNLLEEAYGKEWYKKWSFVEEDLKTIVTVKF